MNTKTASKSIGKREGKGGNGNREEKRKVSGENGELKWMLHKHAQGLACRKACRLAFYY